MHYVPFYQNKLTYPFSNTTALHILPPASFSFALAVIHQNIN